MRTIFVLAIGVASCGVARADPASDLQDKLCILNAAPQVPAIAGLVILASRVTATNTPKLKMVEIDIRAAGLESTLSYSCEFNGQTRSIPRGVIK